MVSKVYFLYNIRMDLVSQFKLSSQKAINSLKEELKSIRTGRATPSLVENIMVETYGGTARLKVLELSTITTDGPAALSIVPYDASVLQDIERAILTSPIGLSPAVQGSKIIIKIPPLSEEQREKFIKLVASTVEEKKVQIRQARDDVRRSLKTALEKKEISEDEKFRVEKQIDNLSQEAMEQIQVIRDKKEKEIREV